MPNASKSPAWFVALIVVAVLPGTRIEADTPAAFNVEEVETPAGPGSAEPNLVAGPDGTVYLSWIEPAGEGAHAVRFSRLTGNTWSSPHTIAQGTNFFVNWADFPSMFVTSDWMAAHWLAKSGEGTYAYDVNVSRSLDGGKTWSAPVVPHRDGTKTEHGFVSMVPWPGGRIGLAWLDGREMTGGHSDHGGGEMTLRFAALSRDGRITDEALLDERVCECCQTSTASTSDGVVVVFRDRSHDEVRDISIVRYANGKWMQPQPLSKDGWKIHGCPVNGPSVDAHGRVVAVAWFTAADDKPKVKLVFSSDAGATFGTPVIVSDASPVGRVDLVVLQDGSAIVSWIEKTSDSAEIRVARIRSDGGRLEAATLAQSSAARASGFPRMVRVGNRVVLAWTGPEKPSRVHAAVLNLNAN